MHKTEILLTPEDEEFLQQYYVLREKILAIHGLPDEIARIFNEATLASNHISGVRFDLINWEDYPPGEDVPSHLKSLDMPNLQRILREVRAEMRANQYVMTYRDTGSIFQPVRWSIMDNLVALFPDFPRLAMNIGTKPVNSISTGHSKGSAPTVEDILTREHSKVDSLYIVHFTLPPKKSIPTQLAQLSDELGITINE